ncbi:SGNH/GDSL hydrolase family protein [Phycicoccus endophyticus]|uniref:SGNH/GDSL hydrolase family protein n=1 Tax=Phycicoccus endophyticus TaxID=1690220 RepID=A0A7G9R0T2_9MICO|nr:SGNH/GDSL hydrolase family protein [Phycicoccus endophyticus]QNN49207.1 SGNH/GDSL hydrolase family protein [Phycicoccus endophyticus]
MRRHRRQRPGRARAGAGRRLRGPRRLLRLRRGAGDYHDGTDYDKRDDYWPGNWGDDSHNRCHRSSSAYAEQTYNDPDFDFGGSFTPVYCSGAETVDLDNPNHSNDDEAPQLDALSEDTSLVTMSIGGNDLGFSDVLTDCVLNGERGVPGIATCQETWDTTLDDRIEDLRPKLVELYGRIRDQAPNARVVIMGYPRLFNDPPSEELNNMLFAEDQVWMNGKADALNAMLRDAAREAGVEFIDPTSAFLGHGVGAPDGEQWINDLDWGGPGLSVTDPGSFHPNAQGHAAMAALLAEQLRHPRYP